MSNVYTNTKYHYIKQGDKCIFKSPSLSDCNCPVGTETCIEKDSHLHFCCYPGTCSSNGLCAKKIKKLTESYEGYKQGQKDDPCREWNIAMIYMFLIALILGLALLVCIFRSGNASS